MDMPDKPLTTVYDQQFESSLDSVDTAESQTIAIAGDIGFSEEDVYQLGYAVREAVVNAVVHGNRYSANKTVHFQIDRSETAIRILIEDSGTGFAPESQGDPLEEENLLNQSGRGIMIIKAFVDQLSIQKRPEGGTRIEMLKEKKPGTEQ